MPELIPAAPGSPEWLAARRAGVTATDIVTILGLSSYDSAYSLYWRKLDQVPEPGDNDQFRLGRELEDYVARRWQEATGLDRGIRGSALYRHSDRAWQMATLDRALLDGIPFEAKTWADADKPAWGKGMVYDEHGPLIYDDQVPPAVRAQVLWQMDVMDVTMGHVGVVFLPSGEFRSYTIEHDDHCLLTITGREACSVCADLALMRQMGEEFMARLRLELPAPDPDASAATLAAVKARFAKTPDKTAEIDSGLWNTYLSWKDDQDAVQCGIRETEILIREQAGEATVYTVDGQPVARRITGEAQVKAYTRHSDYLKRIKTEANGDD